MESIGIWLLVIAGIWILAGVWKFAKWLGRWFEAKQEAYRMEVIAEEIAWRASQRPPKHLEGSTWTPVELEGEDEAYVNAETGEILVPGVKSV